MKINKDFRLLPLAALVRFFGAAVQTLLPSKPFVPQQLAFNAGMVA